MERKGSDGGTSERNEERNEDTDSPSAAETVS